MRRNFFGLLPAESFPGFAVLVVLLLAAVSFTGCASSPSRFADDPKRFSESPFVDAELRFAKWDCIFATKPLLREKGYQRILTRETVVPAITGATTRRGLIVVVFSAEHSGETMRAAIIEWIAMLKKAGFERVVILRSGFDTETLDGLEILEDSQRQFGQ